MIEAMKQGEDLRRMTAAKIFGVSEAEVTKEQHQQAKAVNFGLIYGMSPNRLVKEGIASRFHPNLLSEKPIGSITHHQSSIQDQHLAALKSIVEKRKRQFKE